MLKMGKSMNPSVPGTGSLSTKDSTLQTLIPWGHPVGTLGGPLLDHFWTLGWTVVKSHKMG
jgi:hypothetical protein